MFVSSHSSEATLARSKRKWNTRHKIPIECIEDEDTRQGRLDQMLYVGFTEDHKKLACMFASIVGEQVLSCSKSTPSDSQLKSTDETNVESSVQVEPDKAVEGTNHATSMADEVSIATISLKVNMTAEQLIQLMRIYEDCIENS